uniref:Uncharacterized protein n=1 Tax=Eutreptiella gymnastica TaxID=73025 RepID=A0A7S4LFE0_9EUGL|mmetsp:Transcript_2781/g.5232  ORF Transcript_2781/g.5232 Transcript_2781/m.5232 type:complete len:363 (-) Transcript_2781:365-1453(-)|eukprot:CAMPEP_0174312950 /NCGR_PEP_ID=MMETSP0810-20121108/4644_1 /TAXON_ID=73025 ORGANISM="Eutreptiella gymnastica-like, Strain CCMP1594" /NCGR_SAMPLE_ID=MMETSP0810 /ASSEMBLY_ACC=CAM_ASM_000659 /LENGTH=362 /DNA_ID=CAMNT_0015421539 /DNA_START=91 /DNA_END=1179 /DNA_ORIENTATION=+
MSEDLVRTYCEALTSALSGGDADQIREAYTDLGLCYYERENYSKALECFEHQVAFLTSHPRKKTLSPEDFGAISIAYSLLAELHQHQEDPDSVAIYTAKHHQLEVDRCLQGVCEGLLAPGWTAAAAMADLGALQDQLCTTKQDIHLLVLQSSCFPLLLDSLLHASLDCSSQALRLLHHVLSVRLPRVHYPLLEPIFPALCSVLRIVVEAGVYLPAEAEVLKLVAQILRQLPHAARTAGHERLPVGLVLNYIHTHVPKSSSLYTLLSEVVQKPAPLPLDAPESPTGAPRHAAGTPKLGWMARQGKVRSPSALTTGSTCSSDNNETPDTATFASLASLSDDEEPTEAVRVMARPSPTARQSPTP